MAKFQFKMADGRHIAKCWKRYNSPINGPIWMKHEWSHPIMSPTCHPRFGCHGNGRCLATAHWTFCSYGRLQAERVNQFRWHFVHNSTLGTQWQTRHQILKFLQFKMADGRHVLKYSRCHNSPTNGPTVTQPGCHIPSCSRHVRHNAVAMATVVALQRCTGHSAVMGIWRPNAWTNFVEIWYTTAN